MKRLALAFAVAALVTGPAHSFWSSTVKTPNNSPDWSVEGMPADDENNAACIASLIWRDSSQFSLVKDQADGELYIVIRISDWNIGDPVGSQSVMTLDLDDGRVVRGISFTYRVLANNKIIIRHIDSKTFVDPWLAAKRGKLRMPGNIPDKTFPLAHTTAATKELARCSMFAEERGLDKPAKGKR